MNNFNSTKIVIRRQDGYIITATLEELRQINGPKNPLVASITSNVLFGIPIAFSDNDGNLIFGENEQSNPFFVGHEKGHIHLGHLNTRQSGIIDNLNFEYAADLYAVENGYCSKEFAIKELKKLKRAVIGEGIFRKIIGWILFRKGIKQFDQRIARMSAL